MASCTSGNGGGLIDPSNLPHTCANPDNITTILNLLFITIGGIALLMIVIAGLRMVISGDEPEKIAESKRMIVYSIVGLIIVALAGAIVNTVLSRTS